ncbi:hypothetical protein [Caudoviricetes sp.]|nr:hypothetical protein [Caudoviricetes sp.]
MDITCGACPVQIEGEVDGMPYYFRARGNRWTMGLGREPVLLPAWSYEGSYGVQEFAAGWMGHAHAIWLVRRCIRKYAKRVGYRRTPARKSRGFRRHVRRMKATGRQ